MSQKLLKPIQQQSLIRVGDWDVSPDTCTVAKIIMGERREFKITPRSMDVLRLLIERAGNVVSPSEFLETIWRSPIATDHAVHKAIAELRAALQDEAHNPRYIKTIPKRGYALIVTAEPLPVTDKQSTPIPVLSSAISPETVHPDGAPDQTQTLLGRLNFWRKLTLASALCTIVISSPLLLRSNDTITEADGVLKLAVMPFTSRDFSDHNQILADGIRESLMHGLSKLGHLQVLAPARQPGLLNAAVNSQDHYLRDADHILQGSVMTSGGQLRVIVQLVRTSDGLREYSDQFDLPLNDIFAIQDEIVNNVVSALRVYLNDQERAEMQDWGTTNALAYERFLRGEFYNTQFNPADWERAMSYHRAAIELDPNFLNAYHGLATAANNLTVYSGSGIEKFNQMYQVILDVHREISRIDPDSEILDSIQAIKLRMRGSSYIQQETQMREQILSGDPPPFVKAHYALLLIGARMYDEAIRFLNQTLDVGPYEISPDEAWSYRTNVLTPARAITARKNQLQQRPFHISFLGSVAVNLATLGDFRQAQLYLNQQRELDTDGIMVHHSQIVIDFFAGKITREDDSYQNALVDHPDFYYNNGVLAFMMGDLETGIAYWQSLQPPQLRRLFNMTHTAEKYFPDEVLYAPEYQQLLDGLGAGINWQRRLMEGVMAMEHITGVDLNPQSAQAYDSEKMMMKNNYWSQQDWTEFELHKDRRLSITPALNESRIH